MEKKNKILFVIIVLVSIGVAVAIYFIIKNRNQDTTSNLVQQQSLSTSGENIALGKTTISDTQAAIYTLSSMTVLSKVEEFIQEIDSEMTISVQDEGDYYVWEHGDDSVIYDLDQNYLIFNIEKGINWNEASLNGHSFAQFVNQYFSKSWTYTFADSAKMPSGETIYYAKRNIENTYIETVLDKQETDYLAMKNGKIIYGKILLIEIEDSGKNVPLISQKELDKSINLSSYPKEVYPQFGAIQKIILSDVDYKSDEFMNIANTLSDCVSSSAKLVYLYKNMNQQNLTPVYKLDLTCKITYKDTQYDVPAIGYVSAIDPKYISSD